MKRFARNMLVLLFSVLFTFTVGELVVRLFTNFDYTAPRIFAESKILPWELRPRARAIDEGYWREFRIAVDINSLGYRNEEFSPEKQRIRQKYEVLNAGYAGGYAPDTEFVYFRPKGIQASADRGSLFFD